MLFRSTFYLCYVRAPLNVVEYLVEKYPESINMKNNNGVTALSLAGNRYSRREVVHLLKSYSTIRWLRARSFILLRALVDRVRATLKTKRSLIVAKGRNFETRCELDFVDFVFVTSPDGVFASIMCYL
jgi:hypothetical protein